MMSFASERDSPVSSASTRSRRISSSVPGTTQIEHLAVEGVEDVVVAHASSLSPVSAATSNVMNPAVIATSARLKTGNDPSAMKSVTRCGLADESVDDVGDAAADQQSEADRRQSATRAQTHRHDHERDDRRSRCVVSKRPRSG